MRSVNTAEYQAVLKVLVAARERGGLTQQRVADRLDRHQSFVSKYENGERRLDVAEFLWVLRALRADPLGALRDILAESALARSQQRRRAR